MNGLSLKLKKKTWTGHSLWTIELKKIEFK